MSTKVIAVIGLGFGDEGKGMVTDALSALNPKPVTIRFSGGHQAGHTVCHDGMQHTFANFGSGVLRGVPSYWSRRCTVDPVGLMNELKVLVDTMSDASFADIDHMINPACPVVTPYDKYYNQTSDKRDKHGSCGVGFGATIERTQEGPVLIFSDLWNPTILDIKMELIAKYYDYSISLSFLEEFYKAVDDLTDPEKFPSDVISVADSIGDPKTLIFEGSQGILLDEDYGFFPHVTRSKTTTANIYDVIEHIDEIYYVTRAYQTRHGNGPMTNEDIPVTFINIQDETNLENEFQGKFRRSVLDLDLLKYSLESDRGERRGKVEENLVITCMDQMVDWKYTYKGKVQTWEYEDEFVDGIAFILGIDSKSIYLSRSENSTLERWEDRK